MAVIQVRGTSGSGKTWVMRQVMFALGTWGAVYDTGRRQPLYYYNAGKIVLGHYETACGGCDTIGSAAKVFELTQTLAKANPTCHILQEGLLLSEDSKWSSQLQDLRVIFLNTPLEQCINQIKSRREAAGNDKELNTENTSKRVDVIERARVRLDTSGVYCRRASARQAPGLILGWLNGQ